MGHLLGVLYCIRNLGKQDDSKQLYICTLEASFWAGIPEQMPGDGGSIHSDSGRRQHHRVGQQCAHDGIQELITGIRIGLLFLLLEVS